MEKQLTVQEALINLLTKEKSLLNNGRALAEELDKYVAPENFKDLRKVQRALEETKVGEILLAADKVGLNEKELAKSEAKLCLKKINLKEDVVQFVVQTLTEAMGWYQEPTSAADKEDDAIVDIGGEENKTSDDMVDKGKINIKNDDTPNSPKMDASTSGMNTNPDEKANKDKCESEESKGDEKLDETKKLNEPHESELMNGQDAWQCWQQARSIESLNIENIVKRMHEVSSQRLEKEKLNKYLKGRKKDTVDKLRKSLGKITQANADMIYQGMLPTVQRESKKINNLLNQKEQALIRKTITLDWKAILEKFIRDMNAVGKKYSVLDQIIQSKNKSMTEWLGNDIYRSFEPNNQQSQEQIFYWTASPIEVVLAGKSVVPAFQKIVEDSLNAAYLQFVMIYSKHLEEKASIIEKYLKQYISDLDMWAVQEREKNDKQSIDSEKEVYPLPINDQENIKIDKIETGDEKKFSEEEEANSKKSDTDDSDIDDPQKKRLKVITAVAIVSVILVFLCAHAYSIHIDNEKKAAALVHYKNALAYKNEQQYEKAIGEYNQAIELNPKYAAAYCDRGDAYYKQEVYDKAAKDYDKAIELEPNIGTRPFKRQYAHIYTMLAYSQSKKGNHDLAIAAYTKAIEILSEEAEIDDYYNRGISYVESGYYDKGIADYTKVIEIEKGKGAFATMAYLKRGDAYWAKGNYNYAIADYKKTLEIDPNFALGKQALQRAYGSIGNTAGK